MGIQAKINHLDDVIGKDTELEIMVRSLISQFEQYIKLNNKIITI